MVDRQRAIEQHFQAVVVPSTATTVADAYGPEEDYTLQLGSHRLVLLPPSGEWLWFDPRHEEWQRLGIGPGEVVFEDRDGKLVVRRRPGAGPPRADLGADRWRVRTTSGVVGPWSGAELTASVRAGDVAPHAVAQREGTPLWIRTSAFASPVPASADDTLVPEDSEP